MAGSWAWRLMPLVGAYDFQGQKLEVTLDGKRLVSAGRDKAMKYIDLETQRFIDDKKTFASLVGGVSGIFGVLSVPPDLMVMTYLQLQLLVEVAKSFGLEVLMDFVANHTADSHPIFKAARQNPSSISSSPFGTEVSRSSSSGSCE